LADIAEFSLGEPGGTPEQLEAIAEPKAAQPYDSLKADAPATPDPMDVDEATRNKLAEVDVSGVYYRRIPIDRFSRAELLAILVLVSEERGYFLGESPECVSRTLFGAALAACRAIRQSEADYGPSLGGGTPICDILTPEVDALIDAALAKADELLPGDDA
jgi:hypothetical protein